MSAGWWGVDLDGTLAIHESGDSIETIGKPIPLMVNRVKHWIAQGVEVRIFTARVGPHGPKGVDTELQRKLIEDWCETHLGKKLPVTATKDFAMIELWDDRAMRVIKNTGRIG